MKILSLFVLFIIQQVATAQTVVKPKPVDATEAMIRLFGRYDIVMFGEIHSSKQEYEWLSKLVKTPAFVDHVDDIVVEFGNARYQKDVDQFISGENVAFDRVQKAWRNTIASIPPASPVYGWFYQAVREANIQSRHNRAKHKVRLLMGSPPADWARSRQHKISLPTRHRANNGICMWLRMKFLPGIIALCSSWDPCIFFAALIRLCRTSCLNSSTSPYRPLIGAACRLVT